jgi:hypothetical protein
MGKVLFVAPSATYSVEGRAYPASDNNDGLSPERALLTVDYAVGLCTADAGDVIVMLPGLHTLTTGTVTVDVAGITITGIPGGPPNSKPRMPAGSKRNKSRITNTATAGICFTVTAADVEICHVHMAPTAAGGRGISLANTADRFYAHDNTVAMVATASVTTYGITHPVDVTDPLEDVLIRNCYFVSGAEAASGANGSAINALGTAVGMTIEQCTFELKGTAAWADAILSSHAGTKGLVVRDCDFINPTSATTVITTAINTTGQTIDASAQVHRCYIPAGTDGVTASAMADIVLTESYTATSSGGTILLNA